MQTLENSEKIKDYVIKNIKFNLPKIDSISIKRLIEKIDLDVYAKSDNKNLNNNFNSLTKVLKNADENDINIYTLTEFYYYYNKVLKETNLPFTSSI